MTTGRVVTAAPGPRRPSRVERVAIVILGGTAVVLALLSLLGLALRPMWLQPGVIAFAATGWLVAARRPANPIGWLLLLTGLGYGLATAASACIDLTGAAGTVGAACLVVGNSVWILAYAPLVIALLLLPNGTLPSPRWRSIVALVIASTAVAAVSHTLLPGPTTGFAPHESPLATRAVDPTLLAAIFGLSITVAMVTVILAVASIAVRLRRAEGVVRQQLKWIGAAGVYVVVVGLPASVYWAHPVGAALAVSSLVVIALAIAVAVLRYRLFEIDRIVSRAATYALLTACLGVVYVTGVVALQAILAPFTAGSSVAVAASTLAVAALFQPARRRIQDVVDRRFNRARYDAQHTLDMFSARLRDEPDLEALVEELRSVTRRSLGPDRVSVWLRPRRP